ncbi:uncharacterized protein LAJ45_06616 [Morchella importuna]|uniref:uncharacterized protein n=1 Tax=Morchella importuna TaxID=1174673 RepID=UPI001E8D7D28|nr:uncharacterized protein LAJ45_06616 [Morchella importuna]KAH8149077.1 hypothetical protein LAJ45_06616 [Morchella importuna]
MLSRHDEALTARRMLSRHSRMLRDAPAMLPRMLPRMRMLPRTLPTNVSEGSREVLPEHSPMLTELRHSSYPLKVRQPSFGLLWIDTPSSKDRKAAPVPQKISNVGILNAAVRSVAGY